LRAGLVERPEEYLWNSLRYHIEVGNKDNFLSIDFGLKELGIVDPEERLKRYRRYVYKAGALDRSDKGSARVIDKDIVEEERQTPDKFAPLVFYEELNGADPGTIFRSYGPGKSSQMCTDYQLVILVMFIGLNFRRFCRPRKSKKRICYHFGIL
jgi:hypothetical protein